MTKANPPNDAEQTPRGNRAAARAERVRQRAREERDRRIRRVAVPLLGAVALVGVVAFAALNILPAVRGGGDHFNPPQTGNDRASVRVGEAAPPFMLLNAGGMPVSSEAYRGKPTILVFFRTYG